MKCLEKIRQIWKSDSHLPCGEDEDGSKEDAAHKGEEPHILSLQRSKREGISAFRIATSRERRREREREGEGEGQGSIRGRGELKCLSGQFQILRCNIYLVKLTKK